MSKKNKLARQKAAHELVRERERELKASQAKRRAAKAQSPKKQRRIPKNLVRGASTDPAKYAEALRLVQERERARRVAPKKKTTAVAGEATRRRVEAHVARNKQDRRALVARRRGALLGDGAAHETAPSSSSSSSE